MSRTEDFDSEFWDDPAIEDLSIEATILYIWTWTNSRVGPAGLYKATRRAMRECKVTDDQLDGALAELETADLAFYDGTYVWVKARVKRLRTRTVAMCRGIAKEVAKVAAEHPYRVAFMERYGGQTWASGDRATTIAQEVESVSRGEAGDAPGSYPSSPFPKGNARSLTGKSSTYKGKGKGPGKGPLGRTTDTRDWRAWAEEHLPDLPADFVAVTVQAQVSAGRDLDPDDIRRQVLHKYPGLQDAA
jgi:hypothetical protein